MILLLYQITIVEVVFMAFIQGSNRYQSFLADFYSIDSFISDDNYTRVIDAFVDSLNLKDLGFIVYDGSNPRSKTLSDFCLC